MLVANCNFVGELFNLRQDFIFYPDSILHFQYRYQNVTKQWIHSPQNKIKVEHLLYCRYVFIFFILTQADKVMSLGKFL